jgi:hypothetical protein
MVAIDYLLLELAIEERLRDRAPLHLRVAAVPGAGHKQAATLRLWLARTLLRASHWLDPQPVTGSRA